MFFKGIMIGLIFGGAGRGCGSHDSAENMGAWNKSRASHRNGIFHSGLHLCGNRSFRSDHNFRFSSAIPGGYSSGGRNHCPAYGNPAAILTFLFAFSWFGIAGDNTKAGGWLVVLGVFVGTCLWWGGLAAAVALARKKKRVDSFRKMNRIFGVVLSLFGILVFIRAIPI